MAACPLSSRSPRPAGAAVAWRIWPVHLSLSQRALAFNQRDWILIADFENLTNDPVFDRSLRVALEVAIAQSQYVNVFPSAPAPRDAAAHEESAERQAR